MLKWIIRLMVQPVYPHPHARCGGLPDYLTLRELADLPPHHPTEDGIDGCRNRR